MQSQKLVDALPTHDVGIPSGWLPPVWVVFIMLLASS